MCAAQESGSLIPSPWQGIRTSPYRRSGLEGQCLAPLCELDIAALPWDDPHPEHSGQTREVERVKLSNTRSVLSFLITDPEETPVRVYAKRARSRNWVKSALSIGRRGKTAHEWLVAREMLHRGLPTALPLLWAERRVGGMLRESFLVTLAIERGVSFRELYLTQQDEADRCTWMRLLGANIRLGHDNDFAHDDLNTRHVLLTSGRNAFSEPPRFYYIDLDGARIDKTVSAYRRAHNFFQLFRSLPAHLVGHAERQSFYAGYSGGVWEEEHTQAFDRAIERIALQKKVGKAFKFKTWRGLIRPRTTHHPSGTTHR